MINKLIKSVGNLPAFPATVVKVMGLLSGDDYSLAEVAKVISFDQSITGNILKICNSAYFGCGRSIKTVRDAVGYLGKENLIRAVQTAGISKYYKTNVKGYVASASDLWEHSVAVALMSQILSKKIYGVEDSVLYSAALLHDVGKIVMGEYIHESIEKINELVDEKQCSFLEAEEAVIGMNHAELGGKITGQWNLPAEICQAISFHHRPDLLERSSLDMAWIVYLADQLCMMLGIGNGVDGLAYRGVSEVLKKFNLRDKDLEVNMMNLLDALANARSMLEIV
jgi:putative nucleotidyltransferase with HDIG domain